MVAPFVESQQISTRKFQEETSWPAWFRSIQRQAWQEFLSMPTPTSSRDAWRFSNVQALDLASRHCKMEMDIDVITSNVASAILERSGGLATATHRIIFANHLLLMQNTQDLPHGVVVLPLRDAIYSHENLMRKYFMRQPVELGSYKYAAWHKARLRNGVLIYVPPNTTIEIPIEIFSWLIGRDTALSPHTLIICGENSCVTVLDHFHSVSPEDGGFVCGISDLHLAAGAKATYASIQEWSTVTRALHLNSTLIAQDARATVFQANFGSRFLRSESLSRLTGGGAHSLMLALTAASDVQEIDQRTLQDHVSPDTCSDLLYHNTLNDLARTIFSGLIRVESNAHKTDAYQKVRNLLLSDTAEANSMPGLEILADNVRCTHGATSGQINAEELFYMQTRGIHAISARRLIANGFLSSVLERLEHKELREFFMRRLYEEGQDMRLPVGGL